MKNIVSICLLAVACTSFGQSVVFHENFDLPSGADSVSTGVVGGGAGNLWNTTTQLSVSPSQSYHVQGSQSGSEVYFETQPFSTIGNTYIRLEFSQIAKLYFANKAFIQISTDAGQSWSDLDHFQYRGNDFIFKSTNYFNEGSHQSNSSKWKIGDPLATPTNNWWVREVFDLTGLASDTSLGIGNATGYPDVRLRFVGDFFIRYQSTYFSAGWFIDDIEVTVSNCELTPPALSFDFQPSPCYVPNPTGLIPPSPSNSYPIGVQATDTTLFDSGINTVDLHYSVNGGTFQNTSMLKQGFTDEYRYDLTGIMLGDTVEYYIEAQDFGCPNVARLPADGNFYSFVVTTIPSKCASSSNCQNPDLISNFPWKEDFEGAEWSTGSGNGDAGTSHRGTFPSSWFVNPDASSSHGWSVRNGPTGTPNTGPGSDNTTGNGKYLYAEFSPNSAQNVFSVVETPCIDLSDSIPKMLSFAYHMYGQDIQLLRVDIDTGSGSSSHWNGYFSLTGEHQNSSSDNWKKAYVSLAPFAGKTIKFRLLAHSPAGMGDESDIAIDDLEITTAVSTDIAPISLVTPLEDLCTPSSGNPVKIHILNKGQSNIQNIPLAYRVDGGSIVRDSLQNANLALADTSSFTFSQLLSVSATSPHVLKIWSEVPGDNQRDNDTLNISIPQKTNIITQFPHIFDFENASSGASGGLNSANWTLNATTTQAYWEIEEGNLNNTIQGPEKGLGMAGKFLMLRDKSNTGNDEAFFHSTCVDLSSSTNPQLSFHLYSANLNVEVRIREAGKQWKSFDTVYVNSNIKGPMTLQVLSLSAYEGSVIEIGFFVDASTGILDQQVAIDNIQISEGSHFDISFYDISEQLNRIPAHTSTLPGFNIFYGRISPTFNLFSSKLVLEFSDQCNPNAQVYEAEEIFTTGSSASANFTQNLINVQLNDSIAAGSYNVKAWLETANDSLPFNDTIYFTSFVHEPHPVPFFTDFENCEDRFFINGTTKQWEHTTPAGGAKSGSYAFETNADHPLITDGSYEVLLPPFLAGLDTIIGAEIRFWHKFDFTGPISGNHGTVQYNDNGWNNLTQANITGQNWKSYMSTTNQEFVFYGNSGGWIYSSYPLQHVSSPTTALRLAAVAEDDSSSNWIVDDFEIYVPAQHSAAPDLLKFANGLPLAGNNNVSIRLYNSGRKALNSVDISIEDINGNQLVQEQINLTSPLLWKQSRELNLQTPLPLTSSLTELVVVTSRPNNRTDGLPADDTLRMPLYLLQPIDSMPYCEDFESSEAFVPLDLTTGIIDTFWQHVTPSKNMIVGTHSGDKAWITGTASPYPIMVDRVLYTPQVEINGQTCYQFSFWHWYNTEANFDGGNVEYSLDSGNTWNTLGNYGQPSWYNSEYVQSLSTILPGFSGSSGGWEEAHTEFEIFEKGSIQFRFRFASNASIGGDGWAIDDVCLEEISGNCQRIDLEETQLLKNGLSIYPNPAGDELNLIFSADASSGHAEMTILDHSGKIIRQWQQETTTGTSHQIDVSNLPAGVYSLRAIFAGDLHVKQFVKI